MQSQQGFNFLGFIVGWQRSRTTGRWYAYVEPSAQSRQRLRDAVRKILNHWTPTRRTTEVMQDLNPLLRGWSGDFHFRPSTRAMGSLQDWVRHRFQRWLGRKHGQRKGKGRPTRTPTA